MHVNLLGRGHMTSHSYRKPGLHGTTRVPNGKYLAQKGGSIGTFDTAERASLAVRLFEHWVAVGHAVSAIPRQPQTRDVI